MAINRNTTFNPDDMNFMDRDFGDSDMDNQGKGRVRKAIKLIFAPIKGMAKGFVDKALEDNLNNLENAKDLANDFTSAFGEEYDKFKKDAKELGSSVKELLPNSIRSKFKGAFEDEESSSSASDSAANEIRSAMTSIFRRTTSQQASMTSAIMKSAAADRAVSHAYMKLNASALSSVNQSAASIDYFLKNIYTKYLEKDIELKYRNLHAVSEIKAHINHVAEAFREKGLIGEILENVKLPDSLKAESAFRNKKSDKQGISKYAFNLPKNIAESIFEMPNMLVSLAQLAAQSVVGMDRNAETMLENAGRFAAKNLIKEKNLPKFVQDILNNNKIKNFGQKIKDRAKLLNDDLGFGVNNFSTLINSFGKKLSRSDNFLVSMLGGMIPQFQRDTSSKNKAATEPEGPATFDNITRESIISVIPKHLERIGDNIESLAKAMGAQPLTDDTKKTYDVTTRSLISVSKQKEKTNDFIYGDAKKRREREEESLQVITDNLRANGADDSVWSQFEDKKVQQAITTFFNRSADKHQNIDVALLLDFINNGTKDFNTQDYIEEVFGKTDKKTAKIAAQIIYSSILSRGADGKKYVSNSLKRSITNRITDLGKEIDTMDKYRRLKEQQGVYNEGDYDYDEFGTATSKDDVRYQNMHEEASDLFMKDARYGDISTNAQSIQKRMNRYGKIRDGLSENQRNLADKMAESGFDSGILGLGSFTDKVGMKVKGFAETIQNRVSFLKKFDLVGKTTSLFGKIRSKFTNYDNTIFVTKLRLLNKNEGKFYVGYKKKGENGACNITIKLDNINIDDAHIEPDGIGKFKPNDVLKKIDKLLIEAIKKDSTLKEQNIVDNDTEVICAYTRNYWTEGVYSQAEAEAENDFDIMDDEDFDSESTRNKATASKDNKATSANIRTNKSPLSMIQEDVHALRVKFVGETRAKENTDIVASEQKTADITISNNSKEDQKKYELMKINNSSDESDDKRSEEDMGSTYRTSDESSELSPVYSLIKNQYDRTKNFLGFGKNDEAQQQAENSTKRTLLGKIFGTITGVFGLFKKKSATANEWAQSALKAGVSKGEAIMIGLLGMLTKKQADKDKTDKEENSTIQTLLGKIFGLFKKKSAAEKSKDDEIAGLIETVTDTADNVKSLTGLKDLTKSAKVFKNAKFLRNHPRLLKLAQFTKNSKVLTKLPGVGGNALIAPLLAGLAVGGMGLAGSRSSGASKTSSAISTGLGAGAGALLSAGGLASNPVGWAMAAGLAANAMREGWNDKKTLKGSWNSELTATDSQKGATAIGNLANYLTFGLLNKTGARKYVDRAIDKTALGSMIGGIGGQIAGVGDLFRASNRAEMGMSAPMTELELKRARAKLQTDIKRGDPEASGKLSQFEAAVKAKDWYTARKVSGIVVNASREREDAIGRITKGFLNGITFGLADKLAGSDQNAPMTPDEIKKATKNLQDYAKRHPQTGKKLLLDFEEAVMGERWAIARKICGKENQTWLEKKFGKDATWISALSLVGLLFMNNENEPMSEKEIKDFQNKCMKYIKSGNQNAQQILDRFNDAVQLGNWKVARKIAGKETSSLFTKLFKPNSTINRYASLAGWFMWDSSSAMSQKEIDDFHKKMQYRIKEGYAGAREQLDRFDNAVLTNNWELARAISGDEAHSVAYKVIKSWNHLWLGFNSDPMTEAEIEKFRASMKRKIELGDNTAAKILDRFEEAVGNQQWEKAREISKIEKHGLVYNIWKSTKKVTDWLTWDWLIGDDSKALDEADVVKFRNRMQKLIDQGNPEAKRILDQFEDAIQDGNWKKARALMGKEDLGHYRNFARWFTNLDNNKVHELDNKDKDASDAAKRYRFILSKVEEALTNKKLRPWWYNLIELRDDMRKADLLELDDKLLNSFEKRLNDTLRSAGVAVGPSDKSDIEAYDTLHREKLKMIERKQALLSEISAAQDRCSWHESSKRSELKRLFREVDLLSLEELDDEVLDGYDEELRIIDSKALSTKTYSAEDQKKMTERLKKTNALLNDIDRARDELGFWDSGPRRRLNELQQDIESTLIEDREDDLFEEWTSRLQEVNPHLLGARTYNREEMKAIRERTRKRDLLADAVRESRLETNMLLHPLKRHRLGDLEDEIRSVADDEIDDDMFTDWEDRYKELEETAKTADQLLDEDIELKALLRRRDTLVRAIKRVKQSAKAAKDDKLVSRLQELIDRLQGLDNDEVTEEILNTIENDFNDLISDNDKYKEKAASIINTANKNAADAEAKVNAEKNKPPVLAASNIETYRSNMNADNLITRNPVLGDIRVNNVSPSANKAFADAAKNIRAIQFRVEKKSKFDMESGVQIVLYSVNGGEWFALTNLREQPIVVQLMILSFEISQTSMKYIRSNNDAKEDACDKLKDQVDDFIENGKATEKDLAKLEYEAAMLGVTPYSNPKLYNLQVLDYDATTPSLGRAGDYFAKLEKPAAPSLGGAGDYFAKLDSDKKLSNMSAGDYFAHRDEVNKAADKESKIYLIKVKFSRSFNVHTGVGQMAFGLPDGSSFTLSELRKQPYEKQFSALYACIISHLDMKRWSSDDDEKSACKRLLNTVKGCIFGNKTSKDNLAKLEYKASKLGIEPYSEPDLFPGFEPIPYDSDVDNALKQKILNPKSLLDNLTSQAQTSILKSSLNIEENNIPEFKLGNKYANIAKEDIKVSSIVNKPKIEFNENQLVKDSKYTDITKLQNKNILKESLNSETNDLMQNLIKDNNSGNAQVAGAVNTSNDLLATMCGKLDNVVEAILEHNDTTNEKIGFTAQKSYELSQSMINQKLKYFNTKNPPLFKPSTIAIAK